MERDYSTTSFLSAMGDANSDSEEEEEDDGVGEAPRKTSRAKIVITVLSLATCMVAIVALAFFADMQGQPDFRAFNTLATGSGYPDMSALVTAFQILAGVILAFGCWGPTLVCRDRSANYFIIGGIALAFCAFVLAGTGFVFGKQAAPDVHFISQEVCLSSPGLDWTWRCGETPPPAPSPPAPSPSASPPLNSSNASNSTSVTPSPSAHSPTPAPLARRAQLPAFGEEADRCDLLGSLCGHPAEQAVPTCACLVKGEDTGYHCDEWTTGEEEWCYVDSHSTCVNSTADAASGLLRSTDPCHGALRLGSGAAAGHLEFACLLTSILGNLMVVATLGALCIRLSVLQPGPPPKRRGVRARETAIVERSLDMNERFAAAQKIAIKKIGRDSPQETKLLVFGLFMQATEGDCRDATVPVKPNERKKHEAWAAHRGMPQQQAMLRYCEAVENA